MENLLNTELYLYSYVTPEGIPGSIITHDKMNKLFNNNDSNVIEMDNKSITVFTLKDLLLKGFIKSGSTDLIENLDFNYPILDRNNGLGIQVENPKINGKYMHGSRTRIFNESTGIDFDLNPESDREEVDWDV